MSRRSWATDTQDIAEAAWSRNERVRSLVAKLQQRKASSSAVAASIPSVNTEPVKVEQKLGPSDADFGVLNEQPNAELVELVQLFDWVLASTRSLHTALIWRHLPPRAILPWMVREVSRRRRIPPLRTLFLNMSRSALQAMSGVEARTARLRALGVYRSGQDGASSCTGEIGPDAHFYMFLGDTRESGIQAVPLISIIPHTVALNDGIYWRDFDEKTLKGFKQHFHQNRLQSIRKYLDILTSAARSPAFAFLMPSHFEASARKAALKRLPSTLDLAVIDMGTVAASGPNVSTLLCEMLAELEEQLCAAGLAIWTDSPWLNASTQSRVLGRWPYVGNFELSEDDAPRFLELWRLLEERAARFPFSIHPLQFSF
jgi:hypothetical protein